MMANMATLLQTGTAELSPAKAETRPRNRRARVLLLIKGLGLGGAEKLLSMAAPHFDRDRFAYEVGYFLPWKNALAEELRGQDVPVTCFDIKHPWSVGGAARLMRYLQQGQFDVVHMHLPVPGMLGRFAGKRAGVPALIYTEHNVWQRLNPLTRCVHRMTFRGNDASIAVSADVRRSMRVNPSDRVLTIPNGIDAAAVQPDPRIVREVREELGLTPNEFVIGKVANLTPKKNHEVLLQAFAEFQSQVTESRLVLTGQYAGRLQILQSLADRLGIRDRVIFTGPRTDVLRVVQAFDVFAMSSAFEGLPIALLEAMALEKPVVCTAVGGIPTAVTDGVEGFLVAPGNAAGLADAFRELAADRTLSHSMGEAARARVEREFDIAVMVRRVEDVYVQILKEKGVWTSP